MKKYYRLSNLKIREKYTSVGPSVAHISIIMAYNVQLLKVLANNCLNDTNSLLQRSDVTEWITTPVQLVELKDKEVITQDSLKLEEISSGSEIR